MKHKSLFGRFALVALALAVVALLALACEEEEEEAATPTPAATPGTPTALKPGAAGIASNPREVKGLEGILTLDDGLAMFKERPASEDRTGVTKDTIKLGRVADLTGFLAPYEPAWGPVTELLIKRVNEAGGIHGRKIEIITRDYKGQPPVAVEVTKELVEGDKVFALYYGAGSTAHQPIHEYHEAQKVPNLLYLDASNVGMEPVSSKWDINGQASDILGGQTIAQAVWSQDPNAKVGVVYMDFPPSVAGRDGIRYYAQQNGKQIVAEVAHDITAVDMTPQAQQVAQAKPDWIIYHGSYNTAISLIKALQETVGFKGKIAQWGAVVGDPAVNALIDGVTMVTYQDSPDLTPGKPVWAKLPALAQEEGMTYNSLWSLTFNEFEHLVRALELAGPDLTREGLMDAFDYGFDGSWTCASCLGPSILGPQDHWPSEIWVMMRWNNAKKLFDKLGTVDHETTKGLGLRGNYPGLECKPPSAEFPKGTCPWKQGS